MKELIKVETELDFPDEKVNLSPCDICGSKVQIVRRDRVSEGSKVVTVVKNFPYTVCTDDGFEFPNSSALLSCWEWELGIRQQNKERGLIGYLRSQIHIARKHIEEYNLIL